MGVVIIRIRCRRVGVRHGSWRTTGAVLGLAVEEVAVLVVVMTVGERAIAAGVVIIGAVRIGISVTIVSAVVESASARSPVAAVCRIVVIHVDPLVSFLVMGGHGEGSLVGVDVLPAPDLTVVVARQVAVEVVMIEGKAGEKARPGE